MSRARPVGLLLIENAQGAVTDSCTAFLISPGRAVTSYDCVHDGERPVGRATLVLDKIEYDAAVEEVKVRKRNSQAIEIVAAGREAGYAVISLERQVGAAGAFGVVETDRRTYLDARSDAMTLEIVHHPRLDEDGDPIAAEDCLDEEHCVQRRSRDQCTLAPSTRQGDDLRLRHDCAIAPGSNGAPVFRDGKVVALHVSPVPDGQAAGSRADATLVPLRALPSTLWRPTTRCRIARDLDVCRYTQIALSRDLAEYTGFDQVREGFDAAQCFAQAEQPGNPDSRVSRVTCEISLGRPADGEADLRGVLDDIEPEILRGFETLGMRRPRQDPQPLVNKAFEVSVNRAAVTQLATNRTRLYLSGPQILLVTAAEDCDSGDVFVAFTGVERSDYERSRWADLDVRNLTAAERGGTVGCLPAREGSRAQ
ncbi:MAG: trypsin-like peptidase domain-containing protein [Pseudomonadota bacterium]